MNAAEWHSSAILREVVGMSIISYVPWKARSEYGMSGFTSKPAFETKSTYPLEKLWHTLCGILISEKH